MDSHKAVIREWLIKSENDFRNLSEMVADLQPHQTDLACFCAQQSVEKLLKAVLLRHKKLFGKTHDLYDLAEQVQALSSDWTFNFQALDRLTALGIAARYPGVSVSAEDARAAYALCRAIRADLCPALEAFLQEAS